jgi:metacaspase-1
MRQALCIGINDYPGTGSDLAGCVNDAHDWADELTKRSFETEIMLDAQATGEGMRSAMRRLLQNAKSGDTVVITYSGHGTWVRDDNGDEPDGRDEALVPHDIAANGPLLDDELYEILCDRARGVRAVMISDSCHSGTVARFAPSTRSDADKVKFLPPSVFLSPAEAARAARMPRVSAGRPRHAALLGRRVQLRRALRRPAERRVHLFRAADAAGTAGGRDVPGLGCGDPAGTAQPGLSAVTGGGRQSRPAQLDRAVAANGRFLEAGQISRSSRWAP